MRHCRLLLALTLTLGCGWALAQNPQQPSTTATSPNASGVGSTPSQENATAGSSKSAPTATGAPSAGPNTTAPATGSATSATGKTGSSTTNNSTTTGEANAPAADSAGKSSEATANSSANSSANGSANATSGADSGTAANPVSTPPTPKTTIFNSASDNKSDNASTPDLLAPGPMPKGKVAFVGGTVRNIDHVRNHMTVDIFGGQRMKFFFDDRSHVYHNGVETTQMAVKKGDRVYVDSMLDKPTGKIFARNLRLVDDMPPAEAGGQIMSFDPVKNLITVRDQLAKGPVTFRMTPNTVVKHGEQTADRSQLTPGSLVSFTFVTQPGASRGSVKDVNIIASPGSTFTLFGPVSHLDLKNGLLGVHNKADDKFYSVKFDPQQFATDQLQMGSEVTVESVFNGKDYDAKSINVSQSASLKPQGDDADVDPVDKANTTSDDSDSKDKKDKKHKHEKKEKKKKDKKDSDDSDDDSEPQ